jgi:hypothetical protein
VRLPEPVYVFFNTTIKESELPDALTKYRSFNNKYLLDIYNKFYPESIDVNSTEGNLARENRRDKKVQRKD